MKGGGIYDRVYVSKVFNLPGVKKIPQAPPTFIAEEVVRGGTGFAITIENGKEIFHKNLHSNLPTNIEHMYPDYSLYPEYNDMACGFLTRGCCNACGFCIVCEKEGRCSYQVADLSEFWKNQKVIKLFDPNILACKDRDTLLSQLIDCGSRIDFTQGLDARFITKDVTNALNRIKAQNIHFAFDFMKNEDAILRGLKCFNQYYTKSRSPLSCYVLTNYDTTLEEDWYRVQKVKELGFHPYVMIYQKGTHPKFLTDLSRWCNSRVISKSVSFHDYVPRIDGKSCKELYPDILCK